MNLQNKLDQFRNDNPVDFDTQAKRLLAADDRDLILYVLALGLATAKQRQRHLERDYIKTIGAAPPKERLIPGRVTGSVIITPVPVSKRLRALTQQLIVDVWRIGGEQKLGDATKNDLATAISRENSSSEGHRKNAEFYDRLKQPLGDEDTVRVKWKEGAVRNTIKTVYGEFRKAEAA